MATDTDPFGLGGTTKQALEQAHQALDTYFDFLKKSLSSFPSGGTALGEKIKEQGVENITAFQELAKRLSSVGSFEEALQVQTAFMHSQLNVLSRQTKNWVESVTHPVENILKERNK
jgi:hypothetical protein